MPLMGLQLVSKKTFRFAPFARCVGGFFSLWFGCGKDWASNAGVQLAGPNRPTEQVNV